MTPGDLGALVAAAARDHRVRNGVPDEEAASARAQAEEAVRSTFGESLQALEGSPLGIAWTEELRAVGQPAPAVGELAGRGWLSLDGLGARLGFGGPDWWMVREGGVVLGSVRIVPGGPTDPGDVADTDPVREVLERAARRGEVRLKEVLELRCLREQGRGFPETSAALTAAADAEIGLGSRTLVRWTSGRRRAVPVPLATGRLRRRVVVAVSGVDGAGKSTLLDALRRDLEHCGVPVSRVWLRPGMGLGPLAGLAGRVKRRRGDDPAPGIALVAADPDRVLPGRTGVVGWVWSMLVTIAFLAGVRRQHAAARGVVLYDRHLLDALVTLDFGYAGADLRLQRWLARRLIPRADLTVLLDLPAEEAARRKEGDPIGERAVRRQLEAYAEWLPRLPPVTRLDATLPAGEVCAAALEQLLGVSR